MVEYRRGAIHITDVTPTWTPDEDDDFLVAYVLSDNTLKAWNGASWATIGAGGGGEAFPVGAIYINITGTNPSTELGYGTWAAFGTGRTLVGYDSGDTDFDTAEETGGEKTHTLTTSEMPTHNHTERTYTSTSGSNSGLTRDTSMGTTLANVTASTADAGSGAAHNNVQPYIVVHFWKRTA